MSIREATEADIESLMWIALTQLDSIPVNCYRFPYRDQYPEDAEASNRIRLLENLRASDMSVMVWECPTIEDPAVVKPVAMAIWQRLDGTDRRDVDPIRMAAFRAVAEHARKDVLNAKYGESQFYLRILICHPAYQRRGIGRALVEQGIQEARTAKVKAVTLFATPMGQFLYDRMGFEVVGSFRVQIEGEEEYVDLVTMALDL